MRLSARHAVIAFLIFFAPFVASASPQTILILHSYHQWYEWTDAVNAGIASILGNESDYELAYEYLDSQRSTPGTTDAVSIMLSARYANRPPAVIIAVDDDALRFLLARRDSLFIGIPIAFCGINDISTYDDNALSGITGVTEAPDVLGSLQFALQLFPQTSTILVIADNTTSGIINLGRFDQAAARLPSRIAIQKIVGVEPETASLTLLGLPPDSIVMYLSYIRTDSGVRMTAKESVGFVAAKSPSPVIGCWDFIVDAGAFGGKVVSGRLQGIAAAERAHRMLHGAAPSSIPISAPESYELVIDYDQIERFKLKKADLPDSVVMLGKPTPIPVLVRRGIALLSFVIILEAVTIFLALRGRKLLIIAESRYRTLAEQLPAIVYSLDLDQEVKTTYVSPQLKDMLGYDPQTWIKDSSSWMQ